MVPNPVPVRSIELRGDSPTYVWACSHCGWHVPLYNNGVPNSPLKAIEDFNGHDCCLYEQKGSDGKA
jgi:hypothetical protein